MEEKLEDLIKQEAMEGEAEISLEPPPPPPSKTVLKLDDWSIRRGEDFLEETEEAKKVMSQWSSQRDQSYAMADIYSLVYDYLPEYANNPANSKLASFVKSLVETQQFVELKESTCLDATASALAATAIARSWVAVAVSDGDEQAGAAEAMKKATEEVEKYENFRDGLGGDGANLSMKDREEFTKAFDRARKSKRLRNILNACGRYRRLAQSMQRRKCKHGADEIVGVTNGDNLSRILGSELINLDDPDLELDFLDRMANKMLQVFDFGGVEPVAAGPIVCVVDESGSMDGDKIVQAKSIALAMAWIARQQNRWCCLVGFSGGTEGTFCVLPPNEPKLTELVDWLEHFFSGGTDMDVPLEILPSKWRELGCPAGKTDIVMITDAICNVPSNIENSFLKWKKENTVKLTTIVVEAHAQDAGDLNRVSDKVHMAQSLALDEACVADTFVSI